MPFHPCVAFTSDGSRLATKVGNSGLYVIDCETGNARQLECSASIAHVLWHPTFPILYVGCDDGSVRIFDVVSPNPLLMKLDGLTCFSEDFGLLGRRSGV